MVAKLHVKGTGQQDLPSELGHPCADCGPIHRGRHGCAPSLMLSSVDLVTWFCLPVLIAAGLMVSLHLSASSELQHTCESGTEFVPAL